MAEQSSTPITLWRRISPGLVPVMAAITAFIIGIPLMILTSAQGDIGAGLHVSGVAYSALIEGATGLVINDQVSADDINLARALVVVEDMSDREINTLGRAVLTLMESSPDDVQRFGAVLAQFDLSDEEIDNLGTHLSDINRIRVATLTAMQPLIVDLGEVSRGDVRSLAEPYRGKDELTADDRAEIEAVAPTAADLSDDDLLTYMTVVNEEGIVTLERLLEQVNVLNELNLDPASDDAAALIDIAALTTADVRELVATQALLDAAGIDDPGAASEQFIMVRRLYEADLLTTTDSVRTALETEFDTILANNLIVRRPGNRLLVGKDMTGLLGVVREDSANTPDDPSDDRPQAVFLRLGGNALLFFVANLESMFVRSIPFVIAGLAVALGFKAGLFNIGAEGQLYAGGTFAVWVGYSEIFAGLPGIIHLPLVLLAGLIGGFLWGALPGALRAFTGAHEVITTIMLNFVAVLTVDWLIKSTQPIIMQDPAASIPRTPFIVDSARLPVFSQIAPIWFVVAAIVTVVVGIYFQRETLQQDTRQVMRPLINGVIVLVGGLFLAWMTVRDNLHIGLLIMIFAVWLTDWFLNRTTLGFELRTVGANPNAAKYAGMSVPLNTVLALALSGMLAGLAGTIQVSGVQFNMQPLFFAGLGFDAIAVALLARTNPRNMIPAGFLWGALLTGAPLMQVNADISIDLVKIIQALIIMFIAADMIIRYVWRVPEATAEEKEAAMFSTGWGG